MQIDDGRLAIDREMRAEIAQEIDAEERDADVDRAGILLADRGRRERRGSQAIGRVLLDHHHLALEAGIGGEVIGDGGADGGTAANHDIGAFGRRRHGGPAEHGREASRPRLVNSAHE
jgi:hypothetical protein